MTRNNPDRVFEDDAAVAALLTELANDTASLTPRESFSAAVMAAIDAEAERTALESASLEPAAIASGRLERRPKATASNANWLDLLARRGRLPFVAAAAAAALALWWSAQVQQDFDDEVLASFDAVEITE